MRKLAFFLSLGVLFPHPSQAITGTSAANAYMVENTSGTDPSGNFCYDFQTSPTCSARITNLTATISSSSIPSGSTNYIQNTLTPTTATQQFSVQSGSFTARADISTANVTSALLLNSNAGTSGQFLQSQGPGVPPIYATASASAGGTANEVQFNSSGNLGGSTTTVNSCGYVIGTVVQSSQAIDTAATTSNSTSFVVTTTSATITPKCSTDKIKTSITGTMEDASAAASTSIVSIFRGSTDLSNTLGFAQIFSGTAINITVPCAMTYLDSPSTTSAVVYTVRFKNSSAVNTTWNPNGGSAIILLEEIAN